MLLLACQKYQDEGSVELAVVLPGLWDGGAALKGG